MLYPLMHASAAGCVQAAAAPTQAVPDAERHHVQVFKARLGEQHVEAVLQQKAVAIGKFPVHWRPFLPTHPDRVAKKVVVAEWTVKRKLAPAESEWDFTDSVLHSGGTGTEGLVAPMLRTHAPFDVDVVDEKFVGHAADVVERRHRDQAAGGNQVIYRYDRIGVRAGAMLDA